MKDYLNFYIDKLTNDYYQITIGNRNYIRNIEHICIDNIIPNVKYLSNNSTHKIFNKRLINDVDNLKGEDLSNFDNNYKTLYGLLNDEYESYKTYIEIFTKHFMKALKDLSTNEDFEIKQLKINIKVFDLDKNSITVEIINSIDNIKPTVNSYENYYYGIDLFVKTDLDFNTFFNLIKYDISHLYIDNYCIVDFSDSTLNSKIIFNNYFKGLLNVNDIKIYVEKSEKDFENESEDFDKDEEKAKTDLFEIKTKLEKVYITGCKVEILKDIESLCKTIIEKYENEVKDEIKNEIINNLKHVDDIDTLNEILNLSSTIDE